MVDRRWRAADRRLMAMLLCVVASLGTCWAFGRDAAAPERVVAATVGAEAIYDTEVQREATKKLPGRSVDDQTMAIFQAQALADLIERRLVVLQLARTGQGASEGEIDAAIDQLVAGLEEREQSLDQFLASRGAQVDEVRAELAYKLGAAKYLKAQLTDQALEAYFATNRRHFDGSEARVSHILMRSEGPDRSAALQQTIAQMIALRKEITEGRMTFEAAARQHSAGPSRHVGGDLGFIPRHGLMDDTFAQTAFALEDEEISQPVLTRFGVHLIRRTELRPGDQTWEDVREQLQVALSSQLIRALADEERKTSEVQFTGAMPYMIPGTNKLARPTGS